MSTISVRPIFCKKTEYADLEYLPEEIYDTIARYVNNANKFGSCLDMQDITQGEFTVIINWESKHGK